MSQDQTQPQTHATKGGSSKTDSKPRLKAKPQAISEVEAEIVNGKIVTDEGEYYPGDYNSYRVALDMCRDQAVEAMEVEPEFFKVITQGKKTPYLITGNPPIKVFPKGTMEKGLKLEKLSVRKMEELIAKQAREEAAKKKAKEDEIDSL